MMKNIEFEVRRVSKFFPGVKALKDVSLVMEEGSIHAFLGENGAGKSTMIKIITGALQPNGGDILRSGKSVQFIDPRDAIQAGVGVVYQERNLIPRFSIAENIALERSSQNLLRPIDFNQLVTEAKHWLSLLGMDVDPRMPVSRLSVAKMQMVEIAKALALRSRVLLLDEPTASLTPHESEALFLVLRKLRNEGVSMLFVSHKLEEVQQICDRVTVLRDGQNACNGLPTAGMDRQDLVRLMIGRNEQIPNLSVVKHDHAEPVIELDKVSTALGHRNVSLSVRRGEIVGLYGLVGAGRTELAKCIIGRFPVTKGTIKVNGSAIKIRSVSEAIHTHRIGYVSEDRKHEGLVLMHSILENIGIPLWRKIAGKTGLVTNSAVRTLTEPFIRKLEVRTPSLNQLVGNLSGGNQQKISVAKWLAAGVQLLIIDEPSVGIDIKTKAYLHELIRNLANEGAAILLITSDMPEMITLADRIVVMANYTVQGELVNSRSYDQVSEGIMNLIYLQEANSQKVTA
jgi:ribose transport system ATP-binding protein